MSRALDAAIALHPKDWRERYAQEVRGTLEDVAEANGGRVPIPEILSLGARGLWLRVRGSFAFWGGLVIIAVMVWHGATVDPYYVIDGSLTGLLSAMRIGLGLALPVIALVAGWSSARARVEQIPGVRSRLRRVAVDSAPLLGAVTLGYALALLVMIARFEMPWATPIGLLVLAAQLAMVLIALAVGHAAGAVLPRVLVVFVAPAAVTVITLLMTAWSTPWFIGWLDYPGLPYKPVVQPYLSVLAYAAVLVAVALLVIALRSVWLRAVTALIVVAVIAIGTVAGPAPVLNPELAERPRSELVCSTSEPVVCLWPEQDAAFGDSLRADLTAAHERAVELGLPVDDATPRNVAQYTMTSIPVPPGEELDTSTMGFGVSGVRPENLVELYARSIPATFWVASDSDGSELLALMYATTLLLGVPADEVLFVQPDPYTGQQLFDPAAVPDEAAARALVKRWLREGVEGVRAPS